MANATARVAKAYRDYRSDNVQHSYGTLSATLQLYVNAMLGMTTGGYLAKFDDTQSLAFYGIVLDSENRRSGSQGPKIPSDGDDSGTAGDGSLDVDVKQPKRFELAITSVAITDIGKPVYALFDNQGTLDPSATTYANAIGIVADLVYATSPASAVASIALVEPLYLWPAGNRMLNTARVLAATGAQTLYRWDLGKTILIPSTGAYALTLPAVATCPPGSGFTFVKNHAGAVAVTITGNAAETIDGANTYAIIDANYDCATIVSTGTEWVITSRDIT